MAGFQGADTAQLRTLAQKMQVQSGRLEELRSQIDPLVKNAAAWTGADAETFRASWAQTGPSMTHATQSLTDHAKDLIRQADEQDRASEADATGGGQVPESGGGDAGNFFADCLKLYDDFHSLYDPSKRAWDLGKIAKDGFADRRRAKSPEEIKRVKKTIGDKMAKTVFGRGEEYSKLASWIAGKLELPTGAGSKSFFTGIDTFVDEKAPFLRKAAKGLGPLLSTVDFFWSVNDSQAAFESGDTFHGWTKGLQATGAGMEAVGTTLSLLPIPGAQAIGVPLAFAGAVLNLGSLAVETIVDHWDQIEGARKAAWDWTTDRVNDAVTTVSDGVNNVKNAVEDGVENVKNAAAEGAKNVMDGLSSFGRALGFG